MSRRSGRKGLTTREEVLLLLLPPLPPLPLPLPPPPPPPPPPPLLVRGGPKPGGVDGCKSPSDRMSDGGDDTEDEDDEDDCTAAPHMLQNLLNDRRTQDGGAKKRS